MLTMCVSCGSKIAVQHGSFYAGGRQEYTPEGRRAAFVEGLTDALRAKKECVTCKYAPCRECGHAKERGW